MNEIIINNSAPKKIFQLRAVTARIKEILSPVTEKQFWVRAHLVTRQGNAVRGGHFYGELVDYEDNKQVAKLRVTMWRNVYTMVVDKLNKAGIESPLMNNSEICVLCSVRYHDVYGIGLQVIDVDPYFGESEIDRNRREILELLEKEGILKQNTKISFPLLPNRIGLITSRGSAAHNDFEQTLFSSPYGMKIILAPSSMQGENTKDEVLKAIDLLEQAKVDIICIIRGGGSQVDLAWFDHLDIARKVCLSSCPIWVGIGHEIDKGVLDIVAHTSFKTPTAVAEGIISHFRELDNMLVDASYRLKDSIERRLLLTSKNIENQSIFFKERIKSHLQVLQSDLFYRSGIILRAFLAQFEKKDLEPNTLFNQLIDKGTGFFESQGKLIEESISRFEQLCKMGYDTNYQLFLDRTKRINLSRYISLINMQRTLLNDKQKRLKSLDHEFVLKRGYSLTKDDKGKVITSIKYVKLGTSLYTNIKDGLITSKVDSVDEKKLQNEETVE